MSDKSHEYTWANDISHQFLKKDYLLPGVTLDQRVNEIANTAERILNKPGFASKFVDYMKKGYYSLSSPVWANFGLDRGYPVSCFGSMVEDSMESILDTLAEVGMMSKKGGGTSSYFGKLRSRGSSIYRNGTSSGPVHFMRMFETLTDVVNQGSVRRGQCAVYLPIDHPDIREFLDLHNDGHFIQRLSFGVCISDEFMERLENQDDEAAEIFALVLAKRANTGYPYIFFDGNANRGAADVYKDKGMTISHSNLCTEIMLPDTAEESFVCVLSSMNIFKYDEWKTTDAVETLVYFLDAVMTEFIDKSDGCRHMRRARTFTLKHRAMGIGWLGYHSYLQSKMIPFESFDAKRLNAEIAQTIHDRAYAASAQMVKEGYEEPEYLRGYGRRHSTLIAIAPTKSSSVILGQVSEGIEPHRANYYVKDSAKMKFDIKNPFLIPVLEKYGQNTDEVWDSILVNFGSVQHLDFLSENEKNVFKTVFEISPRELVVQAAQRQRWIDQGQSLNIAIHPETPPYEVCELLIDAWKMGIKSFYYQYNMNAAQRLVLQNINECVSCSS